MKYGRWLDISGKPAQASHFNINSLYNHYFI
nr:MAG TPA: hypothetical protein [Caudoviricetes sp.]